MTSQIARYIYISMILVGFTLLGINDLISGNLRTGIASILLAVANALLLSLSV